MAHEYKVERDDARQQLDNTSSKLAERNSSIEQIEKEVKKVKEQFEAQLKEMGNNHQHAIQELTLKQESGNQNSRFFLAEKDSLLRRINELNMQLDTAIKQRQKLEKDLKIVLSQFDLEKAKSQEKISKLKHLIES